MRPALSTHLSGERHRLFPLFFHPVDALREAHNLLEDAEPPSQGVYVTIPCLRGRYFKEVDTTPLVSLTYALQTLLEYDPEYPVPEGQQMADWLENLQQEQPVVLWHPAGWRCSDISILDEEDES